MQGIIEACCSYIIPKSGCELHCAAEHQWSVSNARAGLLAINVSRHGGGKAEGKWINTLLLKVLMSSVSSSVSQNQPWG